MRRNVDRVASPWVVAGLGRNRGRVPSFSETAEKIDDPRNVVRG